MQSTFKNENKIRSIRRWMIFFMISLFLSGLTAIPVEQELAYGYDWEIKVQYEIK